MGEVTQAQIKRWKAKYGDIFAISVKISNKEKATCYLKKPDLNIITASAKFAKTDPIKGGTVVLENCWLGGDKIIKQDDEAKLGVIKKLGELFKVKEAEVKKL